MFPIFSLIERKAFLLIAYLAIATLIVFFPTLVSGQILNQSQPLTQLSPSEETQLKKAVIEALDFSPEIELEFPAINSEGNYALAEWISNHVAGVVFLKKTETGWVVLGGGGGVPDLEALIEAGIPRREAEALITRYQ